MDWAIEDRLSAGYYGPKITKNTASISENGLLIMSGLQDESSHIIGSIDN